MTRVLLVAQAAARQCAQQRRLVHGLRSCGLSGCPRFQLPLLPPCAALAHEAGRSHHLGGCGGAGRGAAASRARCTASSARRCFAGQGAGSVLPSGQRTPHRAVARHPRLSRAAGGSGPPRTEETDDAPRDDERTEEDEDGADPEAEEREAQLAGLHNITQDYLLDYLRTTSEGGVEDDAVEPVEESVHRSGFVAIVGKPNVGKSTLMNSMLGLKLSIVTYKPQTTRQRILGILSDDDSQIVFLDTPGVIDKERTKLESFMNRVVNKCIKDADVVVVMADGTRSEEPRMVELTRRMHEKHVAVVFCVNKLDALPTEAERRRRLQQYKAEVGNYTGAVLPLSALNGDGVEDLVDALKERLPLGPAYYPKDDVSQESVRFFVSELVREKIYERYQEEIPYVANVSVLDYKERPSGEKDYVEVLILVERESQKSILIGAQGKAIKQLMADARQSIEDFVGKSVYIQCRVKVKKDWRRDEKFLKDTLFKGE